MPSSARCCGRYPAGVRYRADPQPAGGLVREQVRFASACYSVPARFIGHRVRAKLAGSAVTVYDRDTVVERHERAASKGVKVLDLDRYLEILLRKPGALPGATAMVQARAVGRSPRRTRRSGPPQRRPGTRALVEVLLLHRHGEHADVLAGVTAAGGRRLGRPRRGRSRGPQAARPRGAQLHPTNARSASHPRQRRSGSCVTPHVQSVCARQRMLRCGRGLTRPVP
jgi:hypothetical protein